MIFVLPVPVVSADPSGIPVIRVAFGADDPDLVSFRTRGGGRPPPEGAGP